MGNIQEANMKRQSQKRFFALFPCLILALGMMSCTELRLQTLPPPQPTAKLRVFFLPVSDVLPRTAWGIPHKDYAQSMEIPVRRFLRGTGVYEVIPQRDVQAVLGKKKAEHIYWDAGNWNAARKVGRALYADYVLVVQRGFQGFTYFRMLLINLDTGKVYEAKDHPGTFLDRTSQQEIFRKIVRESYRQIFQYAKGDMLVTAMRKGRTIQTKETPKKSPAVQAIIPEPKTIEDTPIKPSTPPPVPEESLRAEDKKPLSVTAAIQKPAKTDTLMPEAKDTAKPPVEKKSVPAGRQQEMPAPQRKSTLEQDDSLQTGGKEAGKPRMVVYDLEAPPPMAVAGLIITEALREELHKLGSFDLVNREDISLAMDELKLQQSGLVQEKEAVQMGRWLAARESVTGRLGSIGSTTLLQTKRTDIETMGTLSFGSLRAPAGREEDFLNGLPDLARKLVQKP
jgi:hypothetical protein